MIEEADAVLAKLQTFEPTGRSHAILLIAYGCSLLKWADEQGFCNLAGQSRVAWQGRGKASVSLMASTVDEVVEMLGVIRTLNPKPGEFLGIDHLEMPSPDVIVRRGADGWVVEPNRSTLPSVIINETYAELVSAERMDEETKSYSATSLNNARWLKRAVEQRNTTTLKISAEIIRQQTDFLDRVGLS